MAVSGTQKKRDREAQDERARQIAIAAGATSFSTLVAAEIIDLSVKVQRVGEHIAALTLKHLRDLERELVRRLYDAALADITREISRMAATERLLKGIVETTERAYKLAAAELAKNLEELARTQAFRIVGVLNGKAGAPIFKAAGLIEKDLKAIANKQILLGGPLKEWWEKQSEDFRIKFGREVRLGVQAGESNDQIVRRIAGSKRLGTKGIAEISRRDAAALVRTAVQQVSNKVLEETYQENDELLRGYALLVTLDLRTSDICKARSGAAWDLKGEPLPEAVVKIPFPGRPPYHVNCRSILTVVMKSWAQIIEEASGLRLKTLEEIPNKVRASMDGTVPASWTYEDWLKTRSEADQVKVLGPGKWKLWKSGKITLAQLVDQSGNPLTLEELKAG